MSQIEDDSNVGISRAALGMRTAVAAIVAVLVGFLSVSCSRSDERQFQYLRITVDGQQTLGISKKDWPIRGVVVYFHGPDENEFAVTSSEPRRALTDKLVNAGFAVVSSQASGNAFGNPASQENYRQLAAGALAHYGVENLYFVAESMGALAALDLLAASGTTRVLGLVAIDPLIDLSSVPSDLSSMISPSYRDEAAMNQSNPMKFVPDAFYKKHIRFYIQGSAELAPPESNAYAFERKFGDKADLSIVDCKDLQAETVCEDENEILRWLFDLEKSS